MFVFHIIYFVHSYKRENRLKIIHHIYYAYMFQRQGVVSWEFRVQRFASTRTKMLVLR